MNDLLNDCSTISNSDCSSIYNCSFYNNIVKGGGGGAIFATAISVKAILGLSISSSHFVENIVYSSYSDRAQGGAIMMSHSIGVVLSDLYFLNNSAKPQLGIDPYTYSGEGGAVFFQSSSITITGSKFSSNLAETGQFDNGAGGVRS